MKSINLKLSIMLRQTSLLFTTILLLFFFSCKESKKEAKVIKESLYEYEAEKIAENVYLIKTVVDKTGWVNGNITLIINEKDAFVVDSGFLPSAGVKAVEKIKEVTDKPVKYLVNTHWHGDHWHGNQAFVKAYPDVNIIASIAAYNEFKGRGMKDATEVFIRQFNGWITGYQKKLDANKNRDGSKMTNKQRDSIKGLMKYTYMVIDEFKKDLIPILPSLWFEKKMVIKDSLREIQILHLGKGNTAGDAMVYLSNEKILITGDVIVYPTPYESGGFSDSWKEVFDKMIQLDVTKVIPGHGKVLDNNNYIRFLSKVFEVVSKKTNQMYRNGTTRDDAIKLFTLDMLRNELPNLEKDLAVFLDDFHPGFLRRAVNSRYRNLDANKKKNSN